MPPEPDHTPIVTPIVAVVGATASGKTGLSLDLAEALGGEIVNTDAMQVYRGMDIGTAKLPEAERRGIPHHLLDTLTRPRPGHGRGVPGLGAGHLRSELRRNGTVPVLVGGSALYTRAILDRFEFPGTDAAVRRELEAELDRVGPAALHERLRAEDPDAAAKILVENGRRTVRALEVIAITGRPYTASLPTAGVRRPPLGAGRCRHRPAHAGPADRAAGGPHVRARFRRGGRAAPRRRASRRDAPPEGRSATARSRRTSPAS